MPEDHSNRTETGTVQVLVFGLNLEQWRMWKSIVKKGLEKTDWLIMLSEPAATLENALSYIAKCEELDIVYISNENAPQREVLERGAHAISEALSGCPRKPWVVFGSELDYLLPIFEQKGIHVEHSAVHTAIVKRMGLEQ